LIRESINWKTQPSGHFAYLIHILCRCECKLGYTEIEGNDTVCQDVDECLPGTICSITQQCNNTLGSYR